MNNMKISIIKTKTMIQPLNNYSITILANLTQFVVAYTGSCVGKQETKMKFYSHENLVASQKGFKD